MDIKVCLLPTRPAVRDIVKETEEKVTVSNWLLRILVKLLPRILVKLLLRILVKRLLRIQVKRLLRIQVK